MANSTTIPNTDPASNITPDLKTSSGSVVNGIISKAQAAGMKAPEFKDYNGQQVVVDQGFKDRLQEGANLYNSATGKSMSAQEYDQMINPDTYGARWGIADPNPGAQIKDTASQGGAPTSSNSQQAASYSPTVLSTPTQLNVTKDQTVAGQMQSLIDPNNPYYQQWQTAGMEAANARGLLNSSMAQTGILNSVMAGATPIAAADAATYAKAAGYNADMSNQFSQFNANAQNTAGAFNAGQANSLASTKYTADKSAATQLGVTDKNNATALAQSQLSADTQKYVADQSAATQLAVTKLNTQSQAAISAAHDANANLIQSNQQAQAAYNSYVAAVAQIDQNANMDAAAKATAIATQTAIFNNAITSLRNATPGTADMTVTPEVSTAINQVNGVDVSQMLNFNG